MPAPRRRRGELARPHARALAQAHVEVRLVRQLNDRGKADPEARARTATAAARAVAPQDFGRTRDARAVVGGDHLEPGHVAPSDRAHADVAATRVGQLVVTELAGDVDDGPRHHLGESQRPPLAPDPLARDRDRRLVEDVNALLLAEPSIDQNGAHLTNVTLVPRPGVDSIENSSTSRRLPDRPSPIELAVL